jgi:hypothetical protein
MQPNRYQSTLRDGGGRAGERLLPERHEIGSDAYEERWFGDLVTVALRSSASLPRVTLILPHRERWFV